MPAVSVSPSVSTVIVPADGLRTILVITNTDETNNCYINFGGTATVDDAFIPAGGNMTIAGDRIWKGSINGLSSSGTITIKYSKASPGA